MITFGMKNKYDIICAALKSAPKYTSNSVLLTKNLCSRYKVYAEDDRVIVQNIVALALDAASSRDFREKAEFILTQAVP